MTISWNVSMHCNMLWAELWELQSSETIRKQFSYLNQYIK